MANRAMGIDYETYSDVDLRTKGLDNYVNSPKFKPLIVSLAWDDDGTGMPCLRTFDFIRKSTGFGVDDYQDFLVANQRKTFSAHNSGFEKAVIRRSLPNAPRLDIRDSAVLARINGANSHLAQCAPQLLNKPKMEEGVRLIRKFCVPRADGTALVDDPDWLSQPDPDWDLFIQYCERDAELSKEFELFYGNQLSGSAEAVYEHLTASMNELGWPVDITAVQLMLQRSEWNKAEALAQFRKTYDPDVYIEVKGNQVLQPKLNLNSLKQLKDWCRERGVQAKSFNEESVDRMIAKLEDKLTTPLAHGVKDNYTQVLEMLRTKRTIGGSSLKKLPVILALTGADDRLRNQYMHCGAGQTYRTSGTGVQMQNLKRLRTPRDMATLADATVTWTNDDLAENIRQVFTSSDPNGALVVGDFSSVESRGLAYLAGEDWKLKEYAAGKDMYKVLAGKIFTIDYDAVGKSQRQTGKVGELSCGYGAGPDAVVSFATGMGVDMTPEDALKLVRDWRAANPKIVEFWALLDDMLRRCVTSGAGRVFRERIGNNLFVEMETEIAPASLTKLHPGAMSLRVRVLRGGGAVQVLERVFHGVYARGNGICYYKPAETKTGDLWKSWFIDPKTKQRKFYSIYGGKLAGILTQSFCRELFFMTMLRCKDACDTLNVDMIGQFHDELVFDWTPSATVDLPTFIKEIEADMSYMPIFPGFPLVADVKHAYRYIK